MIYFLLTFSDIYRNFIKKLNKDYCSQHNCFIKEFKTPVARFEGKYIYIFFERETKEKIYLFARLSTLELRGSPSQVGGSSSHISSSEIVLAKEESERIFN